MTRHVHTIDNAAIPRFAIGRTVDDCDRHGQPVRGRVVEVKEGNKVAIVITETEPADSGAVGDLP